MKVVTIDVVMKTMRSYDAEVPDATLTLMLGVKIVGDLDQGIPEIIPKMTTSLSGRNG
jgi:hypothetical protein